LNAFGWPDPLSQRASSTALPSGQAKSPAARPASDPASQKSSLPFEPTNIMCFIKSAKIHACVSLFTNERLEFCLNFDQDVLGFELGYRHSSLLAQILRRTPGILNAQLKKAIQEKY
jgi:hypothetical protein